MAIKFHYHLAQAPVPRLGIEPGDRLCHIYSDSSLEELVDWGAVRGLRREWLDLRNALPHFDAFGERLRFCGRGVAREEFVRDVRRWRERRRRPNVSPS